MDAVKTKVSKLDILSGIKAVISLETNLTGDVSIETTECSRVRQRLKTCRCGDGEKAQWIRALAG